MWINNNYNMKEIEVLLLNLRLKNTAPMIFQYIITKEWVGDKLSPIKLIRKY